VNVISLFSGVGGFDLGFEQAGFTTVYQCEWDKHATNILNRHWPEVPKWGDVQTLTGQEILRHCQTPDVIIWGSPCQDLSVAGKRAGLDGERSGLFHEGIRIINELREATDGRYPRVSVWENVAGALNSNGGADFGTVLNEMAEAGALVIEWALLDAQHFGVPQRRRRVFVVAIFDPATASRCPDPLLPVGESLRGDSAKGKQKGQTATGEAATGFGSSGFGGWDDAEIAVTLATRDHKSPRMTVVEEHPEIVGSLNTCDGTKWGSNQWVGEGKAIVEENGSWWNGGDTADTLTATSDQQRMPDKQRFQAIVEPFVKVVRSGARDENGDLPPEVWRAEQVNPTLNSFDMGDTRATTAIVEPTFFQMHQSGDTRIQTGVMHTLAGYKGTGGNNTPMVQHQMAVRRLTPLECERLMGWPDNWTDGQADSHRYRQCGNGVATPVAHWIAKHLHNLMGDN
jgi:DNA (cytosine-5)-methyltransferase 1